MLTYCVKCKKKKKNKKNKNKKDPENVDSELLKTKNYRTMLSSKCAVCSSKKS